MATLIMSDGSRKEVSYNQAAEVFAILNGKKKPKNKKQEGFVAQVSDVKFPPPPVKAGPSAFKRGPREHDTEMDKILASGLKGVDKAKAVAHRIRERVQS